MTRLIDADDFFRSFPKLAIEPYINFPTITDRYSEGYSQGYIDGSIGAEWEIEKEATNG